MFINLALCFLYLEGIMKRFIFLPLMTYFLLMNAMA
ncbi:transporter, partial [Salmonella enterica]|nr:transporter [Salmonella enterica]